MSTFVFFISLLFLLAALGSLIFNVNYSIAFGIISLIFSEYSKQLENEKTKP